MEFFTVDQCGIMEIQADVRQARPRRFARRRAACADDHRIRRHVSVDACEKRLRWRTAGVAETFLAVLSRHNTEQALQASEPNLAEAQRIAGVARPARSSARGSSSDVRSIRTRCSRLLTVCTLEDRSKPGALERPLVPSSPTGVLKSVAAFLAVDTLRGRSVSAMGGRRMATAAPISTWDAHDVNPGLHPCPGARGRHSACHRSTGPGRCSSLHHRTARG